MANANDLHSAALALMAEMKKTSRESSAAETIKDYNERRKKATEDLKPVLVEMDARMKAGETFGGCDSMKVYCKTYKPEGMLGYARVRQILTGTSGNEGKVKSLDLTVTLSGFTVNAKKGFAWVSVEIEQEHKLTYKAAKYRDNGDYSNTPADSNGEYEWIHTIPDVRGHLSFTVENDDGALDTPEKLTAALYKKMVATLKSLRMWRDSLKQEFKEYVEEEVDWQKERKEVRSRAAKKGAATRGRKNPKFEALKAFNARNAGEPQKDEQPKKRKRFRLKEALAATPDEETHNGKPIVTITHLYGGASAGGGQNTRMYDFAKCGRRFTPRTENGVTTVPDSGRIHKRVLDGDTLTCPKCIEFQKQEVSEPAKALAAAVPLNTLEECLPNIATEVRETLRRVRGKRAVGLPDHSAPLNPNDEGDAL